MAGVTGGDEAGMVVEAAGTGTAVLVAVEFAEHVHPHGPVPVELVLSSVPWPITASTCRPDGAGGSRRRLSRRRRHDRADMTGATFDLAVRGGTVVTPHGRTRLDVYAGDGRFAALRPAFAPGMKARQVVDAGGLLVLPGMVGTHVHLMDPGDPERESLPSGSAAAVLQGVTRIVEHTHGWPVTTVARLKEKVSHLRHPWRVGARP